MGDVVWLFDGPDGSDSDREQLLAAVEFLRAELARLDEEERSALAEEVPAGRFGEPDEAARLALMLADAPAYLTGQIIGLDGGFL